MNIMIFGEAENNTSLGSISITHQPRALDNNECISIILQHFTYKVKTTYRTNSASADS